MFKDKEKLYQAYHTMLSTALTWALVLVINQYFNLRIFFMLSLFYALVPSVIIYLFDINKKNVISYLLLGSIVPILALIFWLTKTNPVHWAGNLADWCYTYDGSKELYIAGYANVIVFLAASAGAVLFFLLTRRQLAKIVLAVLLLAAMIILCINKIDSNKAVVGIGIFYILTIVVELYGYIYSRKTGRQEKKEGILYLAPVCLLLALLAIAMPSKPEPLQWKAVKHVYNNIKEQLEVWRTDLNYYFGHSKSEFVVSFTGYSDESGELDKGTQLLKDHKVAMKIKGLDKNKTVYLIGSVSDIYTGSSWSKSHLDYIEDNQDYLLDYVEVYYALCRQDPEVLRNDRFMDRKLVKIKYNNIKTKTFFYPAKMSSYKIFSKYKTLMDLTPQINFKKARGKGTEYQTIYYEMNLEGEAFQKMLRDADNFSYDDVQDIDRLNADFIQLYILRDDELGDLLENDYTQVLKERAQMINDLYTALPEELPDRVYELAQTITEGCDTKYDKLKAIEKYLIENYTYSLDAQKIPAGTDYIDYFLFDGKEGYCTSFASSMAVLGRCVGIPTRYVEGFIGKFNTKDEDNNYLIKNNYAHAWAEAYIQGVGWIPFETTPPFYNNRYTEWDTMPKYSGPTGKLFDSSYFPTNNSSQPVQPDEEIVKIEKDNSAEIISGIVIVLSILLLLLLVLLLYYYVLKYRYRKAYEKADDSGKMYMLFLRILKQLKREGFVLDQQETILMLSERVRDLFQFNQITFPVIALIFMRYRYAEETISKTELDTVKTFYEGLLTKEREEVSWFKVWTEEFLFLARRASY